jgi:type IV secretory pathway component VirB8
MVSKILSCRFQEVLFTCSLIFMALLMATFVATIVIALMEPSQRYCKYYEEFYRNSTNAERHLVADD